MILEDWAANFQCVSKITVLISCLWEQATNPTKSRIEVQKLNIIKDLVLPFLLTTEKKIWYTKEYLGYNLRLLVLNHISVLSVTS